ncbi:MAG: hypothetical protein M3460_04525 [Actinomycetota bacterium]|nr:hypothetical protein [Actinomycetota bacterium]
MLDHLDDLESDFSAIHRVDDIHILDGPRFFRLAYRLGAYSGVMAARVAEQQHRNTTPAGQPGQVSRTAHQTPRRSLAPVDAEPELAELQLAGIVERVKVP